MVRHGLVWMAPPCGSWSFMFLASVMQPVYFTARPQYTLAAAQESRLHEATPLQDSRPRMVPLLGQGICLNSILQDGVTCSACSLQTNWQYALHTCSLLNPIAHIHRSNGVFAGSHVVGCKHVCSDTAACKLGLSDQPFHDI